MAFRASPLLVLLLLGGMGLAGCMANDPGQDSQDPQDDPGLTSPERGSIEGIVTGLEGPLAGARVEISRIYKSMTTGTDGRYLFDDLLPTDYRLTVTAEHHRRATERVSMDSGGPTKADIELSPIMLTPDIPAKYGKQVTEVNSPDTMFLSMALPGVTQTAVTNNTKEATFPGFWEIEPEEGFKITALAVVVIWLPLPELEQGVGVHYFRGESPAENEFVDGATTEFHMPEPIFDGPTFAFYSIQNDDLETWGDRNWQVGMFATQDGEPAPAGAVIEHFVNIVVTYVDAEYADQL